MALMHLVLAKMKKRFGRLNSKDDITENTPMEEGRQQNFFQRGRDFPVQIVKKLKQSR